MARRLSDSLIFDSIRLEGGLFVPAILENAARGEGTEQKPADYNIPKGLSLVDEQGRAFRIASALWKAFEPVRARRDVDASRTTVSFVNEFIRDALGYADLAPVSAPIELIGRAYPITGLACGGRVPVVIAPHGLDLDTPDECFAVLGSGSRRRSAYQLAQQFLNASAPCTWALVTNGRQLRLVRDADTLTRPAYLEADLELILRDQRYSDFAAVWRLFHSSRAGKTDATCIWDAWRREGLDQGEPVRAGLRDGVTEALLALGTGFLDRKENVSLRQRLQDGTLTKEKYFQQLLRLIYRCLFLFTIEERGLIHLSDDTPDGRRARETYAQGYAFRRLRERALRRAGFDRNCDLWTGAKIVFQGLANGEPRLALPALGGLFAQKQCPDLDGAKLENHALLTAMRRLRWAEINRKLTAIDYRNMGPEELGSVYESLLELVPTIDLTARRFGFVGLTEGGRTDGNERKKSGSYYTPDSLVQELLDSALDPVIAKKLEGAPADPAKALLSISVIDPACGSGHFLLAAARRLAERLAELRAVDGAVTPADYRHALREVIAHCVYGVDRNPMALELARTALWLEGYEPGKPLSFLDYHLICGDALLGLTDFKALTRGIPTDAFTALSGDSKMVVKALATENRSALKELSKRLQNTEIFSEAGTADLLAELTKLEALPESTPVEVETKSATYEAFLKSARESHLAQAADLIIAAFLASKATETDGARCPTTRTLGDLLFPRQGAVVSPETLNIARELCREARVLHWPLAFAGVFARGRFDCVLGNPPWERIKLQEEEFFASQEPLIASAKNKAERSQRLQWLAEGSLAYHLHQVTIPHGGNSAELRLYRDFSVARRMAEAVSLFAHVAGNEGGRYPLSGVGDVNTYALFAETISQLTHDLGRSGFIVPTGIVTDDSTKTFFSSLVDQSRLVAVFSFENEEFVFPGIHHFTKFCLMTIAGVGASPTAQFVFFARQVEHLRDQRRRFTLSSEDFRLINPNTRTCPVFRSNADAELTRKIYRRVPVLIMEADEVVSEQNPWGISFRTMFHMASDSDLFLDRCSPHALPLYEAKMIHQFDHRWATYRWDAAEGTGGGYATEDVPETVKADATFSVQPRYWVEERHVLTRLAQVPRCVTQAWEDQDEADLLVAFATWIEAAQAKDVLAGFSQSSPRERAITVGGSRFSALPEKHDDWLDPKAVNEALSWAPLSFDELESLRGPDSTFTVSYHILSDRSPRWLTGWRNITNATNERTVIASVMPRAAVGHSLPLWIATRSPKECAALLANLSSITLDYVARQKLGGTNLTFGYFKQFPVLPPAAYSGEDLEFIVRRVLQLTYTSNDMAAWAADLGYVGVPFTYEPISRAKLRAELDAYFARLYGLTRADLAYIADPVESLGTDYPTKTFHWLKTVEIREFGEFRTRRLVLEAWDKLAVK